jgi:hypothetical protein
MSCAALTPTSAVLRAPDGAATRGATPNLFARPCARRLAVLGDASRRVISLPAVKRVTAVNRSRTLVSTRASASTEAPTGYVATPSCLVLIRIAAQNSNLDALDPTLSNASRRNALSLHSY